jgi:hypothetical protein
MRERSIGPRASASPATSSSLKVAAGGHALAQELDALPVEALGLAQRKHGRRVDSSSTKLLVSVKRSGLASGSPVRRATTGDRVPTPNVRRANRQLWRSVRGVIGLA